jgi:hypothetical protein
VPTTTKPAAAAKPAADEAPVYPSLVAALAAFQRGLPSVRKDNTARVDTRTGGQYQYKYADLTDVNAAILPALAAVGLAFHTGIDTVDDMIILRWELAHVHSNDVRTGTVPLGRVGTDWQSIGSSSTYARRYALTSATGVAPGGDDDDAAHNVTAGSRPVQNQKPVERPTQVEYLPHGLYDLGSVTSRKAAEEMFYTARRAGHLNLMLQSEGQDVPFGAWLQETGRSLGVDEDAAAIAAHEADLAAADADALAEQHEDAGDRR